MAKETGSEVKGKEDGGFKKKDENVFLGSFCKPAFHLRFTRVNCPVEGQ